MKPPPRLNLTLLGGFQAKLDAGPALVFPTRKTQALLAYLALPLGQAHQREKLATVFWGDMPEAQARGNLRHALSRIRAALPKTARGVIRDGTSLALDPSLADADVTRFERLIANGTPDALEEAATVYTGDLLAGLSLDERAFDEWLASERERLRELAIQGLGRLVCHQQKAGAAEPGVHTALRLLALDPLQESAHRTVMRLYARLGRRGAALRQYQLCVDVLKRELHVGPETETTKLYQSILASRLAPSASIDGSGSDTGDEAPAPVAPVPSPTALTNLPAATSELIGREAEVAEVAELLRSHRFVSLIGAGGVGKTQLGLEVARLLHARFADGAWLAELGPLSDPEHVHLTVASALGLTLPSGAGSPERVAAALGARELLVVLDNCEHVIEAAARMAEALLRASPLTRVIATSREPLRAPGEYVYRVPSLEVPAEGTEGQEHSPQAAAVTLFIARVRALEPRFSLDPRSTATAGAVCRRLDGIPLAIELAAARAATLGLEQVATRLDDRFRLLRGGHRTALPRHKTLRATLDWSYELLPENERAVLRCLCVFVGSFALEGARAVVAAEDVIDSVTNLVGKSLVAVDVGGGTRYRLLETTRAYALEKLRESGEDGRCARSHAEYYRDLFERAELESATRPLTEWLAAYGGEIDNVRVALDWAFSPGGDAAIGVAVTAAAVPLWMRLSLSDECRGRVERALSVLEPEPGMGARRTMQLSAALGWSLMQTKGAVKDARAAFAKVLEIAQSLDDTKYGFRALWGLWVYHFNCGEFPTALALAQRSVAARGADAADLLVGDRMIGQTLHYLGDQTGARRHLESMLTRYVGNLHASNDVRFIFDQRVTARSFLARILWLQGFPDEAMRTVHSNIEDALIKDHALSLCNALVQAACPVALFVGDLAAAEQFVAMLLDRSIRHALAPWQVWGRCLEAVLIIKRGDLMTGLELLGTALADLREIRFAVYYIAFVGEFAEALGRGGRVAAGLTAIDEALARSEHSDERWCLAELLRIKGELVLREGTVGASTAAGNFFSRALQSARQQHALSWELRCATSLAGLWHQQGRTGPARELLAPVFGRFTEGFDTADLKAAKALLGRLGE